MNIKNVNNFFIKKLISFSQNIITRFLKLMYHNNILNNNRIFSVSSDSIFIMSALQEVIQTSLIYGGLSRGLKECTKAMNNSVSRLCVLAMDCDSEAYIKFIEAMCIKKGINLIKIDYKMLLGRWAGLCKYDKKGNIKRTIGCSCVVVKNYGKESRALKILNEYIDNEK